MIQVEISQSTSHKSLIKWNDKDIWSGTEPLSGFAECREAGAKCDDCSCWTSFNACLSFRPSVAFVWWYCCCIGPLMRSTLCCYKYIYFLPIFDLIGPLCRLSELRLVFFFFWSDWHSSNRWQQKRSAVLYVHNTLKANAASLKSHRGIIRNTHRISIDGTVKGFTAALPHSVVSESLEHYPSYRLHPPVTAFTWA